MLLELMLYITMRLVCPLVICESSINAVQGVHMTGMNRLPLGGGCLLNHSMRGGGWESMSSRDNLPNLSCNQEERKKKRLNSALVSFLLARSR